MQGDLWKATIVILLRRIEKCLNRTGPKKLATKKIANGFGNQLKKANYARCQKKLFSNILRVRDKRVPHSQISFKSW